MADRVPSREGQELLVERLGLFRVAEQGAGLARQGYSEQPLAIWIDRRKLRHGQFVEDRPRLVAATCIQEQERERRPMQRIPRKRLYGCADGGFFFSDAALFSPKKETVHARDRFIVERRRHAVAGPSLLSDQFLGQPVVTFQ